LCVQNTHNNHISYILYINSLRPSVHDGARVRHKWTTGPGPAKPRFGAKTRFGARVQADRAGVLKPRSLLKLSPQSRVLSPDHYRSQVPTPRLQRPERLKKIWLGPGGAQVCETGSVTKPGLPTKTRVPGHKPSSLPRVDRNRARVFPGLSSTSAQVPELGHLSPFSL
jgi:hypothetical protein